jgi:hypothetical protein
LLAELGERPGCSPELPEHDGRPGKALVELGARHLHPVSIPMVSSKPKEMLWRAFR